MELLSFIAQKLHNIVILLQYYKNKNECSVAATGPPIFEGPRENPKSLSSSKAEKFEFELFGHFGGTEGGREGRTDGQSDIYIR